MEIENIKLLENIRKYLYALKLNFKTNRPLFFQKKKLKNYYNSLQVIEKQIKKIDDILFEYYQK